MGSALAITRTEHTAVELRNFAAKSKDGPQVRRLLAIASVLDGCSRTDAAEQNGMDRQTLRDWVHRYNDESVEGLKSRFAPGRAPVLSEEQMAELKALVIKGPDPATDKVVRWRCLDLRDEVARRFSVEVHESTIGKWLHQLGLTRLQPRTFHPKKNAEVRNAEVRNAEVRKSGLELTRQCRKGSKHRSGQRVGSATAASMPTRRRVAAVKPRSREAGRRRRRA